MILPSAIRGRVKRLIEKRDANAILITGRSGSGKTTLARILASGIAGCPYGEPTGDIIEKNVGDERKIDDMRNLVQSARFLPGTTDGRRVFILDEVHALTGEAASALLKPLEEPPAHAIWILATNQPHQLLETITNRCLQLHIPDPSTEELQKLLDRILRTEKALKNISIEHRDKLIAACVAGADNVPRTAIQFLQSAVSSAPTGDDIDGLIENCLLAVLSG